MGASCPCHTRVLTRSGTKIEQEVINGVHYGIPSSGLQVIGASKLRGKSQGVREQTDRCRPIHESYSQILSMEMACTLASAIE